MASGYRGLGFDPTPGEPGAVTQVAAGLRAAAESIGAVEPALRRASELSEPWQGAAADAFRVRLGSTPGRLADRAETLTRAADTLDRWAETLLANKRRTEELDDHAVRLRKRLRAVEDLLQDKQNARDLAASPAAATAAATELFSVSTLVSEVQAELERVLERAGRLGREHRRAADAAADTLAGIRGVTPGPPAGVPALVTVAGGALERTAAVSGALAGLLLPVRGAPRTAVPTGAAGALAAALSPGANR